MALKIVVFAALVGIAITGHVEPGKSHTYVQLYPTKEHIVHVAPGHHGGEGSSGAYHFGGAGLGGGHGGGHGGHHHVDYFAPAHYSFEYAVHDPHTGDIKEQKESRKGDHVEGYYTLKEADGRRRIVHYTADKHSGFNAVVKHEGKAVHAAPVSHHGGHGGHYSAPAYHAVHAAPAHGHHHAPATSYAFVSAPVHHSVPVVAHHSAPVHGHFSSAGHHGHGGHGFYGIASGSGHHAPATSFSQIAIPAHHGHAAGHGFSSLGGGGGGHHNGHSHSISTHITHIVPKHHH